MTASILVVGGAALLATVPNHPGAPADPALHPAVHLAFGAVAILAGLALGLRRWVR